MSPFYLIICTPCGPISCLQAGDADTNGAVAGALLGCKLGASEIPDSWLAGLKHKDWLDGHINK